MSEIDIKQLQNEKRFSDGGIQFFFLLLYLPFGIIIAIIRILLVLIAILLGNILPDISFTRILLSNIFRAIFGIVIHIKNIKNRDNVKIVISNYISPLDHFVIHTVTDCILPYQTNLPSQLSYALGIKNFKYSTNLEELKKSISTFIVENSDPALFQPENKMTNGKSVLKFKDWPFSLTDKIQPICLQLRRPIFDISITTITSSYWSDIFWYLFSPWTVYDVCFLPIQEKNNMTDSEFAEKVRQQIATGLKVEACSYGASDLIDWEKKRLLEQRRARMIYNSHLNNSQSNNPELHEMTRQVKEVLPNVPYNIIFKELVRTKSVDMTISNILEGHIAYVPETVNTSVSSVNQLVNSVSPSKQDEKKETLCTAATTFPKSARERMQSFQERKLQLILNARKRYMDKHGISALALNSNNC